MSCSRIANSSPVEFLRKSGTEVAALTGTLQRPSGRALPDRRLRRVTRHVRHSRGCTVSVAPTPSACRQKMPLARLTWNKPWLPRVRQGLTCRKCCRSLFAVTCHTRGTSLCSRSRDWPELPSRTSRQGSRVEVPAADESEERIAGRPSLRR